jgi:DNA primase
MVDRGLIPEELINRIRDRADIVEVISAHLSLSKAGQNFKGLCPFHSEKTPSFIVSPARQMFHCFGCGEGGNVFTFLMKIEGSSFPTAVRNLGEKYGIRVEEKPASPAARQRAEQGERLVELNKAAAEFFHKTLLQDPAAEPARVYLKERGVTAETIERFAIGYAPQAWDGVLKALSRGGKQAKVGWTVEDLASAGLIVARDQGGKKPGDASGYYDRFRGRVILPIRDLQKRVIGFGGRVIDDGVPKYLNSPETPLFRKGRTLYGLEVAREGITREDQVVIVEGYFDAIALHQADVSNVVATLGTALTAEHVDLIRRFTRRVVLLFDPDAAGVRAALRTLDLFLGAGLAVQVGSLPEGEDPDTFVRSRGTEAFTALVRQAPSLLDFTVAGSLAVGRQGSVEDRVRCVEEVLALLQKLSNPVEKAAAFHHVADQLGLDEKVLMERYRQLTRNSSVADHVSGEASVSPVEGAPLPKDEEVLVRLLLHDKLTAPMLAQLAADDFTDPRARRLIALVLERRNERGEPAVDEAIVNIQDDPQSGGVVRALSLSELPYDDIGAAFRDSLKALKLRRIMDEIQEVKTAQMVAERAGQAETARALMLRQNALQQERQRLLSAGPLPLTEVGSVNA